MMEKGRLHIPWNSVAFRGSVSLNARESKELSPRRFSLLVATMRQYLKAVCEAQFGVGLGLAYVAHSVDLKKLALVSCWRGVSKSYDSCRATRRVST